MALLFEYGKWEDASNKEHLMLTLQDIWKQRLFVDPEIEMVKGAKAVGADCIELYTEPYAKHYHQNKALAVKAYIEAAEAASAIGLGINAGHDLDLHNLKFLKESIPNLNEVSIGHALISDALYLGIENTIQLYLRELR